MSYFIKNNDVNVFTTQKLMINYNKSNMRLCHWLNRFIFI